MRLNFNKFEIFLICLPIFVVRAVISRKEKKDHADLNQTIHYTAKNG
jgi:hypothetical protein